MGGLGLSPLRREWFAPSRGLGHLSHECRSPYIAPGHTDDREPVDDLLKDL